MMSSNNILLESRYFQNCYDKNSRLTELNTFFCKTNFSEWPRTCQKRKEFKIFYEHKLRRIRLFHNFKVTNPLEDTKIQESLCSQKLVPLKYITSTFFNS